MSEEKILESELELIKQAKLKQENANLQAEKFVALLKISNLEFDNLVMTIYNKYGLKIGKDTILENGTIKRIVSEHLTKSVSNSEDINLSNAVEGDLNG